MLTIYAPSDNPKSKAWEVFNGVKQAWPDQVVVNDNSIATEPLSNSMFWGFVNNNLNLVKKLEARKHNFWFTDTPYFGRFNNNTLKPDNTGEYVTTAYMQNILRIVNQIGLKNLECKSKHLL